MQYKEFLLADLVFEKTNARKYAFDILNHLGMTTEPAVEEQTISGAAALRKVPQRAA
jgi:hypothetical protein